MAKRKSFTSLEAAQRWAKENMRGKWSITSEKSDQRKGYNWVIWYSSK